MRRVKRKRELVIIPIWAPLEHGIFTYMDGLDLWEMYVGKYTIIYQSHGAFLNLIPYQAWNWYIYLHGTQKNLPNVG